MLIDLSIEDNDAYQFRMARHLLEHAPEAAYEICTAELFYRRSPWVYTVMPLVSYKINKLIDAVNTALTLQASGFSVTNKLGIKNAVGVKYLAHGIHIQANVPIVQLIGPRWKLMLLETPILSFVNTCIRYRTVASQLRRAAQDKMLVDMGTRRASAYDAHIAAEMAIQSGWDSTSNTSHLGANAFGTMAHSYVQSFHSQREAFESWLKDPKMSHVLLVDTYDVGVGVADAIRASISTGINIDGIRIDSGDLREEAVKARSMLNAFGMKDTKIFVSNDLDVEAIQKLIMSNAPIDGFGVGTKYVCNKEAQDFACVYKFVEADGKPVTKGSAGKGYLPYRKEVFYNENLRTLSVRRAGSIEDERYIDVLTCAQEIDPFDKKYGQPSKALFQI